MSSMFGSSLRRLTQYRQPTKSTKPDPQSGLKLQLLARLDCIQRIVKPETPRFIAGHIRPRIDSPAGRLFRAMKNSTVTSHPPDFLRRGRRGSAHAFTP